MKKILLLFAVIVGLCASSNGQVKSKETQKEGIDIGLGGVRLSGLCFVSYSYQEKEKNDEITTSNVFALRRGYITLKKDISPNFSIRYTQDINIDKEGKDAGTIETKVKYMYLKAKINTNINWLTGTYMEAGLVHRPWIAYEQSINSYRVQGLMATDRNKIFIASDLGVMIAGNIGAKMDSKFLKTHNKSMKGKYCSYVIGVYNGGGYTAVEKNKNKILAARFSFRPLTKIAPELQLSGALNVGKGNTAEAPEFSQYLGMLAWTGKQLTLTAQANKGTGDSRGKYVAEDDPSEALKSSGYSFFGEYKIKNSNWAIWGRYDSFTLERINLDDEIKRTMGGISYRINKSIRTSLDIEHINHNEVITTAGKLNVEVKF